MPLNHFSLIAGLYNHVQYNASESFLKLLSLPPNGRLLDAGGGTGRVAEVLRLMVKNIVVADPSYKMLLYAAHRGLATTCARAENLPFSFDSFERIIMMDALHHVLDQSMTIKELWRVLSPGGRLIIVEPDINKFVVKLVAITEKMLLLHSHFLAYPEIASLFINHITNIQIIHNKSEIWICVEKVRYL